ncbi:MAG: S8 family serine peptidase [Candidatus Sericytochromatia bacterium]
MKSTLQQILVGVGLIALTACSSSLPLAQRPMQLQSQSASSSKALLEAPKGTLRRYRQAQTQALQATQTLRAAHSGKRFYSSNADGSEAPVLTPSLPELLPPPEPVSADPANPINGIGPLPQQPFTPPLAPSEPNANPIMGPLPNPVGEPGATQPNSPNQPGGVAPGGNFRYEDLQWHLRKIEAERAWRITQGNPDLTVAVIDTGVDYGHAAFQGRILKGYDFSENDTDPLDDQAHGTHVAGLIAGNDGNIKGVAPRVKILAIKVFSQRTFSQDEYALARAIRYATQYGADVINLSLGSPTLYNCDQYSDVMRALNSAIDEAYASGVTVITAAGNEASDFIYGRCSVQQNVNQIPVVATTELDRLAPFSNFSNLTHPKAVSAPGTNMFSTVPRYMVCHEQYCDMPYDYMDGTSMASPIIAGTAALIRSAMYDDYVRTLRRRAARGVNPGPMLSFKDFFHGQAQMASAQLGIAVSPTQLAERLLSSFTNAPGRVIPEKLIYEGRRDPIFGFGRTNTGAAVEAAANVFTAAGL